MLTIKCRMYIGLSVTYFIHDRNCTVIYDDGHALPPAWQPSCGIRSHRFAHEQLIQVLPRIRFLWKDNWPVMTTPILSYSVFLCLSIQIRTATNEAIEDYRQCSCILRQGCWCNHLWSCQLDELQTWWVEGQQVRRMPRWKQKQCPWYIMIPCILYWHMSYKCIL